MPKKDNVAVDIVSFGEDEVEETEGNLKAFVEGVQSGKNSHLESPAKTAFPEALVARRLGLVVAEGKVMALNLGLTQISIPNLLRHFAYRWEKERARLAVNAPAAEGAASTTLLSIQETKVVDVNLMDQGDEDDELARAMLLSQGDTAAAGDEDVEMGAGEDEDEEGWERNDDEGGELGDEEMSEKDAIAQA